MNQQTKLEIINHDGWRKEFSLTKGIVHIGSADTNDVVLNDRYGSGVAPLQVQLITTTNGHTVHKLINLGDADIVVGSEQESVLAPRSVLNLTDGLQFKLGEFTLIFHAGNRDETASVQNSRSIGLKLKMPTTQLNPNRSLEGLVTVCNLGRRVGARFDLSLDGLEPDCFDIAPGPLLSSGAEKDVLFRLHHRGHKPLAGKWRIVIRAMAPETYPGEQATVSQIIDVLPFYRHQLSLVPTKKITTRPPETTTPAPPPAAPAAKQDAGWGAPVEDRPAPALVVKAGAPRKPANPAQPPTAPVSAAHPDWWSEPVETMPPPQVQAPASPETEALWAADAEPAQLQTVETTELPSLAGPETQTRTHTKKESPVERNQESDAIQPETIAETATHQDETTAAPDSEPANAGAESLPAPVAESPDAPEEELILVIDTPDEKIELSTPVQSEQPEQHTESNSNPDDRKPRGPAADAWDGELETESSGQVTPAQKLKVAVRPAKPDSIVKEEEEDWWATP
ncbi:MAG: hypothetical protein D6768_07740 [Chloroflexi bacterium]|nr:MAG: hypothetical protein D6768_07740 [Chloroflexota bacterium]